MAVKVRDFKNDGKLYLIVHRDGRRHAFRASSDDGDEARREAGALEKRLALGLGITDEDRSPTFGELSERYLREATADLAATTREDRKTMLGSKGVVGRHFYELPADEIRKATLLEWWSSETIGARSIKTRRNYLAAITGVLGYAVDLELIEANPVDELRLLLRRRNRTKGARAATTKPKPTPIESPADVQAFCVASAAIGGDGHLIDLLLLDGGLRLGEVGGLRWESFWWGRDEQDTSRSIGIEQTRPRGRFDSDTPKSGLARRVALSLRLRRVMRTEWVKLGQPTGRIFPHLDQSNYRSRHFDKVCTRAKLGHRMPKDLRDTYASQLLTVGIQLGYISEQLGHADVAITGRHYARWAGTGTYRRPLEVRTGEVPTDLLARLVVAPKASPGDTKSRRGVKDNVTIPR